MRLVSQDGMMDVPYEQVSVEVNDGDIYCGYSSIITRHCTERRFAEYSSRAKALKVMEMVRCAYCSLPVVLQNVDVSEEVEEMFRKLKKNGLILRTDGFEKKQGIEYVNNVVFQFPKDEEVEI